MIVSRLAFACVLAVGCGSAAELEPASTEGEAELSCSDVACEQDMAALRFVNSSGALRNVHVDGVVECVLEPDAECLVLVEPSVESVVHVTAEDESSPCSGDPRATLGVCACATVEIRC